MEQLKADMGRLTRDLEQALDRLEEVVHVMAVERWWRRVFVGFIVLTLLAAGSWMSWDRQSDCERSVRARAASIDATVHAFDTTWDQVASSPEGKASLLAAIRADQERIRPKRDCSWPV
jgi:predicted negative regulator of RcsB-dependent stress response